MTEEQLLSCWCCCLCWCWCCRCCSRQDPAGATGAACLLINSKRNLRKAVWRRESYLCCKLLRSICFLRCVYDCSNPRGRPRGKNLHLLQGARERRSFLSSFVIDFLLVQLEVSSNQAEGMFEKRMEILASSGEWLTNFFLTAALGYMLYVLFSILFTFRQQELTITRQLGAEDRAEKEGEVGEEGFEEVEKLQDELLRERGEGREEEGDGGNDADGAESLVQEARNVDNGGRKEIGEEAEPGRSNKKNMMEQSLAALPLVGGAITERQEASSNGTPSVEETSAEAATEANFGTQDVLASVSSSVAGHGEQITQRKEKWAAEEEDWEGVESSELEDDFHAAATLVEALAVGQGHKIAQDVQLTLYAFYKQATAGPCGNPQPSLLNMKARAKWNAWKKLGEMRMEEAMLGYIHVVETLYPDYSEDQNSGKVGKRNSNMGPVFSTLAEGDDTGDDGNLQVLQASASEGDISRLQQLINEGCPIDSADEEGRTALHWAADRGQLAAAQMLLAAGAAVNAKDGEGQTALHYAATCGHEALAEELLKYGADPLAADKDGVVPDSVRPHHWKWPSFK